jgi:hypothetical protein
MSDPIRYDGIPRPLVTSQNPPYPAITQRWVNTGGEYAYNRMWYCGRKSLPEIAPNDADSYMADEWNVSTNAPSTMHTDMISRGDETDEMHADRSTVRGFLGDHDSDIHMDEDHDSDASSALTSLPSRYNTPKRIAPKPLLDDTTSINSQDEQEGKSTVSDLILACAEQEVEDDDVKSDEYDDGASHTASELASYPTLPSDP